MFDVFYFESGPKPNLFAHERAVDSVQHAQQLSRTRYFWIVNYLVDYSGWDWLYEPKPWESHQRHAWCSQHQLDSGTYLVPRSGYSETNYHTDRVLRTVPDLSRWYVPSNIDTAQFDWSWHPMPDEQYEHHFPTQHQSSGGPVYGKGTGPIKLESGQPAVATPDKTHWIVHENIDPAWDWSWHPDALEPPYIYVWGNQWNAPEFKASVEYHVPGATERKYMSQRTCRLPAVLNFAHNMAVSKFDYSWEPNPFDPPYIYVFGNQWNSAVLEPTVVYTVPGATEIKYVNDVVATVPQSPADFVLHHDAEFDFSWRPNPFDPPYIYVFGNQWHSAEIMPTVKYTAAGATERKYVHDIVATLPQRHTNHWHTIEDCEWDYSWVPDPGDPPYIYVFGNQWHSAEIMPTVTYTVPGATERKYMDMPRAVLPQDPNRPWYNVVPDCDWDYSWVPDPGEPPYIYVFGNQHWPAEKMPTIEYRVSGATERKYMNYPCAELLPDMTNWTIPPGVDPKSVDLSWVPDPGEPPYIYQFATQHQKTGGPVYSVPGATETKYLEHVQVPIQYTTVPVVEINHLDGSAGQIPNTIKTVRYFDNYRDTLIRLAKSLMGEHEWIWVCSSICDYSGFDFSWHPERWQTTMLHVFASNEQKFGDTFYMHVPTFAERAEKKALLEWYSVNYVPRISVPRRSVPVIEHTADSHVDAVKTTDWAGPLALFTTNGVPITVPAVPLWRQETKTIVPLSTGASAIVVPRTAKGSIKTQLYDYPYIDKTLRQRHSDQPLDVVFISNGEKNADQNYQRLKDSTYNRNNLTHRVDGVKGRVAAYHAAARKSTTPWFFAVFAKLSIANNFNWTWQPDRMQQPKHYIFHAYNPCNGLTYGHQAMIAYNRDLVLANPGQGLDFTLDSAHEVVPIESGTAWYTDTAWSAWRTAFREVIKLEASKPDVESEYRLSQWLTKGDGWNGEWSIRGAEDAVEYYQQVKGNPTELRKSYEWDWLASYAFVKRSLTPDQ